MALRRHRCKAFARCPAREGMKAARPKQGQQYSSSPPMCAPCWGGGDVGDLSEATATQRHELLLLSSALHAATRLLRRTSFAAAAPSTHAAVAAIDASSRRGHIGTSGHHDTWKSAKRGKYAERSHGFGIDISSNWIRLAFLLATTGMSLPEKKHQDVRQHLKRNNLSCIT
ncbi:hypothetical protein EJB05_12045, partial [Eragrostis curvula]